MSVKRDKYILKATLIRYLLTVPKPTYFARITPISVVNYQSSQHDDIDRNLEIPTKLLRNSLKSVLNLLTNWICWQN